MQWLLVHVQHAALSPRLHSCLHAMQCCSTHAHLPALVVQHSCLAVCLCKQVDLHPGKLRHCCHTCWPFQAGQIWYIMVACSTHKTLSPVQMLHSSKTGICACTAQACSDDAKGGQLRPDTINRRPAAVGYG